MNFIELDNLLMELDEHEKMRMELVESMGREAYSKYNQLRYFTDGINQKKRHPEVQGTDNILIRKNKRFIYCLEHKHDYIEMIYVYKGIIESTINGEKVKIKQGEVCILDHNIIHLIEPAGINDIAINIIMHNEFFNALFMGLLSENDIISKFIVNTIYSKKKESHYLLFHCNENEYIQEAIKRLICEWYSKVNGYYTSIHGLLLVIFTELMRGYQEKSNDKGEIENTVIKEIQKYLIENHRTTDLKETADYFNFHPDYLSKLIKQYTGVSFVVLLKQIKLQESCNLLKNSTLAIDEIIDLVGYSNVSYFYRLFKQTYNKTPVEYRNENSTKKK